MSGVFGDGNQFVRETIKISRVECWLKDAPKARKKLTLKSNSGATGFIETQEFGRIKFKGDGDVEVSNSGTVWPLNLVLLRCFYSRLTASLDD